MLSIILLLFSLLLQSTNSCNTENDASLKQTVFFEGTCQCREYLDVYAICFPSPICVKFPRTFRTNLKCLKVQTTGIECLLEGDLANLSQLTTLYIENNRNLVEIQPKIFKDMKQLVFLSISYNPNLIKLDEHVFEGLDNLETLSLKRNGFNEFKDFSLSLAAVYIPKLITINLIELNCQIIEKDDFVNLNGSNVRNIFFDESQIKLVHPDALTHLSNLKNLSVGETLLSSCNLIDILMRATEKNLDLMSLNLNGWGFKMRMPRDLFNVIANTTIKELVVSKNLLHTIDENTFPPMPNIEKLVLDESVVSEIKENSFSNFLKLKQLYFKRNKMISIPKSVLLPTLEVLDMSSNTKMGISYFTIEDNILANMTSLHTLDVNNNNLRQLYVQTFTGLNNLKRLNLYECNIVIIADNSFGDLKNLEHLNLGKNRFAQRTFHKGTFQGLENLKYLSLESCSIDFIPANDTFGYLTSLETLNLKRNFLMELMPDFISFLRTLKVLNVDDNRLKIWHTRVFKDTKVEVLTASHNTFTYLTVAMLADISQFKMIDISRNLFYCDCDNLVESFGALTYRQIKNVLSILNRTSPYCLLPEAFENTTIVRYYETNQAVCKAEKVARLLDYLIPSLVCTVLILLAIILSYIYRWHIRYWIFLTKLAISQKMQFKKKENLRGHTNYLYDAFVSYSSEDRNFVVRLVSMLENYEPFLKLCVYERDFEIGTIISESVLESLSRSRKTLLIISNSYIKSQWCTWEAQVAENHRLFFENEHGECVNDSLIMIKLGNISSSNISPMLKYLMKTRIYLQWDSTDCKQKQFWEKLRNALAPALNTIEEKTGDSGEEATDKIC